MTRFQARSRTERLVPPERPELRPGETITTIPDRWCMKCEQPRPRAICAVCGGPTIEGVEAREVVVGVREVDPSELADLAPPDEGELPESEQQPESEAVQEDSSASPAADVAASLVDAGDAQAPELEPPPALERPALERPARVLRAASGFVPTRSGVVLTNDDAPEPARPRWTPPTHRAARAPEPPPPTRLRPHFGREEPSHAPAARFSRGERAMATRTGMTTIDERGREVQSMQRGQGKRQRPEEALRVLWEEGTVDTQIWARFAQAGAQHYETPEDCASFADALYIEMMLRQQGQ